MNQRMVRLRTRWIGACLAMALCAAAFGQGDLSTVRGTVSDPSGALAPNVVIELVNTDTNNSRKIVTNENGDYEIPYVPLGTYRLSATAPGFKNFVVDDIVIRARELRRVDVVLELGAVGAEVTVTDTGAQLIATEGSQVANGFSTTAYVDSPLSQSFFPQAYMTTLPNIQTAQGSWTLRFAGQSQVVENLDGVTSDGSVNLVQNMNDFEDLQVVAVNNSAEYSRVAQFSMAGKSGTNRFHGKVYYDVINSALQARNYFNPVKVPYKEHRGGANVNGPIIKDKLFFYFGYSLVRIPSSSFYNRNVATERMRSGDFSDYLAQAKPVVLKDPLTGVPFPGNVIPSNRLNPVSVKTQDLFIPHPNQGSPGSTNQNYGFLFPHPTDLYRWDSHTDRLDWKISEKNTIFARYINRETPYVLNGSFADLGTWTRQRKHHSIVANDTHVFSPHLVNSFNWGWIKDYFIDDEQTDGFTPQTGDQAVAAIGLQGVNPNGYKAGGFPTMNFVALNRLFQQPGGVNLDQNILQFTDSMTWSHGKHVIKWGSDLRLFRDHNFGIPEGTYGTFTFDGSLSGIDYADFLLGLPYNSTRLDPLTQPAPEGVRMGLVYYRYVQSEPAADARLRPAMGLFSAIEIRRRLAVQLGPHQRQRDRAGRCAGQNQPVVLAQDQHRDGAGGAERVQEKFPPSDWRGLPVTGWLCDSRRLRPVHRIVQQLLPRPRHRTLPDIRIVLQQHHEWRAVAVVPRPVPVVAGIGRHPVPECLRIPSGHQPRGHPSVQCQR